MFKYLLKIIFKSLFFFFMCAHGVVQSQTLLSDESYETYSEDALADYFKTNVEVLSRWKGKLNDDEIDDWAGHVRVKVRGKLLTYAVIITSELGQTRLRVRGISQGVEVPDCSDDCSLEVDNNTWGKGVIRFGWWSQSGSNKIRTTTTFKSKGGHWTAISVDRQDSDQSKSIETSVTVSLGGRRSTSERAMNGQRYVGGRNGEPLRLTFGNYIPNKHWPEKK